MNNLRIECPGCQQGFEVSEELEGRTVECGSCEHRFQVTTEVLTPQRERFYPDESHKEIDLSRFGRVPAKEAPVEFRTMEYDQKASQTFIGPIPPVLLFATIGGLLVLVGAALVLYFGSLPSSPILQDVERPQRLILAGFFGFVGFVLLTWGMVRKRFLGAFLGLLGAGGLLALAHYLPVYRTATFLDGVATQTEDGDEAPEEVAPDSPFFPGITEEKPLTPQEVMKKTRWQASVFPLISTGDEKQVAAIWVRSMAEFHKTQIRSYLMQELNLPIRPDFRELRDGGIFVLSGVPLDLDQVEFVVERFGEVEQVIPELRLVQMKVNTAVLGEVSNELTAKLNNPQDGAFYSLNYSELIALDRGRVKNAIHRLSMAEPIRMRKDITVRLVGLLSEDFDSITYGNIAAALQKWSEEGDGADRILADIAAKKRARGLKLPDEVLRFLSERKTPTAAPLMVGLWSDDPIGRQRFLEDYGSQAAPLVVPFFVRTTPACQVLLLACWESSGPNESWLPCVKILAGSQDEEFKTALQKAINRVGTVRIVAIGKKHREVLTKLYRKDR